MSWTRFRAFGLSGLALRPEGAYSAKGLREGLGVAERGMADQWSESSSLTPR